VPVPLTKKISVSDLSFEEGNGKPNIRNDKPRKQTEAIIGEK